MGKAVLVGVALGLSGLLGYSVVHRVFFRVDLSDLAAPAVDLGDLATNETREFVLQLSNKSSRPLVLTLSGATCGCIAIDTGEITIPGKATTNVRFQIRAPNAPAHLQKSITLQSRDFEDLQWVVPIKADVVAEAWAVPSNVVLEGDESALTSTIMVNHTKDIAIGRVLANSPALTLSTKILGDDLMAIELQIKRERRGNLASGSTVIQVFGTDAHEELLRIPVEWKPRRTIRCSPEVLVIERQEREANDVHKTVLIFCRSKENLGIDPLVPWIRVDSVEARPFGFIVRLRIEKESLPATFHNEILRFTDGSASPAALLSARF
jgi:hypothetical protein